MFGPKQRAEISSNERGRKSLSESALLAAQPASSKIAVRDRAAPTYVAGGNSQFVSGRVDFRAPCQKKIVINNFIQNVRLPTRAAPL